MSRRRVLALIASAVVIVPAIYAAAVIRRGFSARDEPSSLERIVAQAARNLAIPGHAKKETNPWKATPDNLKEAREIFTDRCASCHGIDGSGQTTIGRDLYPKPPDLRSRQTQSLTDGQIHYIIENGVR